MGRQRPDQVIEEFHIAVGFLLGVLRTLVLVPLVGGLAAVLLELRVILGR